MPCDTIRNPGETEAERRKKVQDAMDNLRRKLGSGEVSVIVGPQGAVGFRNWSKADRNGVTDVCAYRKLRSVNAWELRQAVNKAEALAGRNVDARQVAMGMHTHDGKNWGKH